MPSLAAIDYFRILGIRPKLACNWGLCGESSNANDINDIPPHRPPLQTCFSPVPRIEIWTITTCYAPPLDSFRAHRIYFDGRKAITCLMVKKVVRECNSPLTMNFDSADPSSRQDACHMNSVKWPCSPWVLAAQWIERPPCVREVMGSIPVGDSDIFFVPRWIIHVE